MATVTVGSVSCLAGCEAVTGGTVNRLLMGLLIIGLALIGHIERGGAEAGTGTEFRLLKLGGGHVKWSGTVLGHGAVVTYAFATDRMRFPEARNCGEIVPIDAILAKSRISSEALQREVTEAFAMWERAANIRFQLVQDPAQAGILIGAQASPEGRAFANVNQRTTRGEVQEIEKSLVCLNPAVRWKIGFDGDFDVYDLRYTMAHEIGHAIGLDHPKPSGQLMAYKYDERFRELQSGDTHGAATLYGPRR